MVPWRKVLRFALGWALLVGACSGESTGPGSSNGTGATGGTGLATGGASGIGAKGGSSAGKGGKAGKSSKGGSGGTGGTGLGADGGTLPIGGESGEPATGGTTPVTGGSAGHAAGRGGYGGLGNSAGSGGSAGSSSGRGPIAGGPNVQYPPGWTCAFFVYGDGVCDCGCGAQDSDCEKDDFALCERCNAAGSCNTRACPGKIDENEPLTCVKPPAGWSCSNYYYGDGDCDCGCGALDMDCPDQAATSCVSCAASGSCAGGQCPGPIDPADNTKCKQPEGWTCPLSLYSDGIYCDCGCGIVDPDCASASRNECDTCWKGCSNEACPGPIDKDNNAVCTGVPSAWRCLARFYHDGAICNCGCGVTDPDCDDKTGASCDACDFAGSCSAQACPGTIDPYDNAYCRQPPPPTGWTCPSYYYADGSTCNCGCGVPDLDCATTDVKYCEDCSACGSWACPGLVDPSATTTCSKPPASWECQSYLYGDGYCDCGCGAPDPDCPDALKTSCMRCSTPDGSCSPYDCSTILANDNTLCTNSPPADWTCPRKFYGDQACDCGCGVKDPDCASSAATSCVFCNDPGSCSTGTSCPGTINASDNSKCGN